MQRRTPPPSIANLVSRRLAAAAITAVVLVAGFAPVAPGVRASSTPPNWERQSPAQAPAGRQFPAMAYDSRRGRTVLFGGDSYPHTNYLDTWEWDGSAWSSFFTVPSPPASVGPGMAYDSARGVTVLLDNNSHTWEWNGSTWVQRITVDSPPPRVWTAMVYDSARGQIVLFGGDGTGGIDLGDTWAYDGTNWSKLSPLNSPAPRFGMALAFDSARGVVVLFGGRAAAQRVSDTWEWDGTNWFQRTPTTSPNARLWHSIAYDAHLGASVMFGGDQDTPLGLGPANDTWMWDGTNWMRDWPAAAPSPRAGQAMAYDSAAGRSLMFGGSDEQGGYPGVLATDTWLLGAGFITPDGSPLVSINPTHVVYGAAPAVGSISPPASVVLVSSGTGPLLIDSITTGGDFAVSSSDCPLAPVPLAVGSICTARVTFTPTACATSAGSLTFTDNAPTGSQSIPLQGGVLSSACDADLAIVPPKDLKVPATSPSGALVSYQSPGFGDEEGTQVPTCDPAAGSPSA
jgi:hypothetical protein